MNKEEWDDFFKKNIGLVALVIVASLVLVGSSYAWYRLSFQSEKEQTIVAGKLSLKLSEAENAISVSDAIPQSDDEGLANKPYLFTLANDGTLNSHYTIFLEDIDLSVGTSRMDDSIVKYSILQDGVSLGTFLLSDVKKEDGSKVLATGLIEPGKTINFSLVLWISDQASNDISGQEFRAKLKIEGNQIGNSTVAANSHIKAVYQFDQNSCVTGEEASCVLSECYQNRGVGSCPAGTIVKYEVSPGNEKIFYVLHDDGVTLTLQQRENIIRNTMWYTEIDNTKGPLTVLATLEEATKDWSFVNNQKYEMGNSPSTFTSCSFDSCSNNKYSLARNAKARMITLQEAVALGCNSSDQSCPVWMYNYLAQSTSFGGTVNDTSVDAITGQANFAYWTMSSYSESSSALFVDYSGSIRANTPTSTYYGARPVIVVFK